MKFWIKRVICSMLFAFCVLFTAIIFNYGYFFPKIYYPFDIFTKLKVAHSESLGGENLLISGHVMGSSECVGDMIHWQAGEVMIVAMTQEPVWVCLFRRGSNFSVRIPLTTEIKKIYYIGHGRPILILNQ
jgi:hypothetical protein